MKIAEMAVKCCTRNPKAHTTEECFNCEFKNGMCDSYKLAKILHEEGYEQTDELKRYAADLNNRRHLIWAIGCDYDGCNTVESLKELIDELVSYTQLPSEQIPDITSRTGKWIVAKTERAWNDAEYPYMHKCSLCGNEVASQDLTPYCAYCGAKMKETIDE